MIDKAEDIAKNIKLETDGTTGEKKDVKAFFVSYGGNLQVHFKYGKTYYRFNAKPATEEQRKYNEVHNIR